MPTTKKPAAKKPAAKKPAAKKPVAKKAAPKKKVTKAVKKKPQLACDVCGMVVTVDKACGCVEEHPIMCCGEPMEKK